MTDQPTNVLESDDPTQLAKAVAALAKSRNAQDHQTLLHRLQDAKLLSKLNTEQEYNESARGLRVHPILEALSRNPEPSAHRVLLELTQSSTFTAAGSRVESLIEATAVIRPAPPELVTFWDRHAQPNDGYTHLTIDAIIKNGSEPALGLFQQKLLDAKHDEDDKIDWFRSSVLTHRNDENLIRACETLLAGPMSASLKSELIDALFDYRPEVWYMPAVNYSPPPLSAYGSSARAQSRRLGEYVLQNFDLTPRQKAAVELKIKAIKGDQPAE